MPEEKVNKTITELSEDEKRWKAIGEIFNTKQENCSDLVKKIIEDKSLESMIRCAAVDRYVELMGESAATVLENIARDFDEDEALASQVLKWLGTFITQEEKEKTQNTTKDESKRGAKPTRGIKPTRGAIRKKKLMSGEEWLKIVEEHPSEQVRFLAKIGR